MNKSCGAKPKSEGEIKIAFSLITAVYDDCSQWDVEKRVLVEKKL